MSKMRRDVWVKNRVVDLSSISFGKSWLKKKKQKIALLCSLAVNKLKANAGK